jgi:hypothetical protein
MDSQCAICHEFINTNNSNKIFFSGGTCEFPTLPKMIHTNESYYTNCKIKDCVICKYYDENKTNNNLINLHGLYGCNDCTISYLWCCKCCVNTKYLMKNIDEIKDFDDIDTYYGYSNINHIKFEGEDWCGEFIQCRRYGCFEYVHECCTVYDSEYETLCEVCQPSFIKN